jgi:hypothetical protein
MNKATWKVFYRMQRIAARECRAGMTDLLLWGTAYTRIGPLAHDGCQHIPIDKIRLAPSDLEKHDAQT